MMEHLCIHALVRALKWELERGVPGPATMSRLASLLEEHIRVEEKTLFPLIERIVPEVLLRAVTLPYQNRSAARGPGGAGVAVAQ